MIELRHLRYFITLAEDLNFRRAAERIHIDQASLSRAIRELEDQLGAPLFVRLPRKLHLTPAGLRLLRDGRKLLVRFERLKRAARETHALYQAPLRIGVADGVAQPMLPAGLIRWRAVVPEVPLELAEMRASELVGALKSEEVDVGFSFGVPDDDAIAQVPAWRYPLMALLPCDHELTGRPKVALHDLLAFPLLSYSKRHLPGLHSQQCAVTQKYVQQVTLAGDACSLSGYITRVAAGTGVGLCDFGHVQACCRSDLVALPIVEPEHFTTFALYKQHRFGLRPVVQRFVLHVSTLS